MLFGSVLEVVSAALRKRSTVCAGVLTEEKKKKTDLETVSERYCPLAKELVRRNSQVLNVVIVFHVVCLHRIKTCG